MEKKKYWNFMIDQGGTFTDVIGISPNKKIIIKKVLSKKRITSYNPILEGINQIKRNYKKYSKYDIDNIKVGTTIGTNALLERNGSKVLLLVTKGLNDNFIIGTQQRENIFARHFIRKDNIFSSILAVDERVTYKGKILIKLNEDKILEDLKGFFKKGYRSIAIVLLNSFTYPVHEKKIENIAKKIGFINISCSNKVSPTINFTSRGFTTLVDAYLNPLIQNYIQFIENNCAAKNIFYMQSNGLLTSNYKFSGKNSVLSGPAGGVNGGIGIAKKNKIKKIIGFDMGGTSADIWNYDGQIEKKSETIISGIFIKTPSLDISSIASGGGSIVKYENKRFIVGPESAGAFPGPACYRNNGPLTLTDCNLSLGRISKEEFPKYFGKNKKSSIDIREANNKLKEIYNEVKKDAYLIKNKHEVAESFINIAIENMVSAIKKITIQKGSDIRKHALLIFGSASGQYCCKIAEKIGIKKIIFSPYSSVLSSYGIGLSKYGSVNQYSVEKVLQLAVIKEQKFKIDKLFPEKKSNKKNYTLRIKYYGCDTIIPIQLKNKRISDIKKEFFRKHKKLFGFNYTNRKLFIDSIELEIVFTLNKYKLISVKNHSKGKNKFKETSNFYYNGEWKKIKKFNASYFSKKNVKIIGPAIFSDFNTTIFIEKNWSMKQLQTDDFSLEQKECSILKKNYIPVKNPNPEMLEIFNSLFFSIADQMGIVLKKTAQSVNIKERKDFSCALFNSKGELIANAPHIPIHLGAMSDTIKFLIKKHHKLFRKGVSLLHNDPFSGGTHLPDLTVVTPFLDSKKKSILFFLANRAHHSDIGGITPGSMPAFSKSILDEGIVFDGFPVLANGKIQEKQILKFLNTGKLPSRDAQQNLYDIKAQIASNQKGILELKRVLNSYGKLTVNNYVKFIQKNCSEIISQTIKSIPTSQYKAKMDNGAVIQVKIFFDRKLNKLIINFNGTSKQLKDNFNAPLAVTKSVVIYFLRTLVTNNIPLNEGFLKNIKIIIPENSMLNPKYPSAVVAGNVETSQTLIDVLNISTKVQAACYGTMNNITFGNKSFGYYETICGGEGASFKNNGADAVHCHMTNTSITDPEILEWYYPVRLTKFAIRKNSGGKGKWVGGNGVIREIEFLENLELTILSNRRIINPFGLKTENKALTGENLI
ncbi:MAG: 5-oxoprolinase, partial [Rickettsiales bacterium]